VPRQVVVTFPVGVSPGGVIAKYVLLHESRPDAAILIRESVHFLDRYLGPVHQPR
jgi:hypothetical protein